MFFWGNALADSGTGDIGSFVANSIDEQSARNDPHSNANKATITDVNDFNRDGLVNTTDQQFTRSPNTTSNETAPNDINISAAGPFAPVDEEGAAEANSTTPLTVPTGDSGISSGLAAAALLSIGSDAVPEPWEPYRPSESTVVITVPLSTGLQLATLVDIADPAFRLDDADWLEGISADDRLLVAG